MPTVTGTAFGPMNFQLTVTQSNLQSSTCTVHHGVVATDANGAVVTATGNPALDSAIATLIGPQIQFGKNPWIYYDQAAAWDAAVQIADMDVHYFDYWDIPQPGTVSVTTGSNVIYGSGTNFFFTLCNADGTPKGPQIIVWYPTGRVFNGVPETGRRRVWVGSCQSGTQLTMSTSAGISSWKSDAAAGSGLQYSITPTSGSSWDFSSAPADYYDNVQAYYELYYRSGIDTYLIAARKLADRFWTCTEIDRGMAFNVSEWFGAQQGRSNSVSGLVLRALDTADGHPDMWAGLHLIWTFTHSYLVSNYPGWVTQMWSDPGIDPREEGYLLAQAAYGALWDTDPTWQAYCRAMIQSTFQAGSKGIWPQAEDPVQHAWLQYSPGAKSTWDGSCPYSWCARNPSWAGSTVVLTNGSTAVACTGTNCGWQAADFATHNTSGASCSGGANCGYVPVLFTDSAKFPSDSSHTDADAYCFPNGCTFIDSNHFILDRPYDGISGTHGWIFGVSNGALAGNLGMLGWGQEPFMEGILAWAFNLAGKAMACTSPGIPANCADATSAQAYANSIAAATWVSTYGSLPSAYGISYYAGYPSCGNPVSGSNIWCTAAYSSVQSREIGGDSYRGLMSYYLLAPSPSLKTLIDNWYAAMWGKPGTNPLIPSPDGQYDNNFDGSGCSGCGFYLQDGPPYSQKFFGQHFGISNEASWPVVRQGRF